ncbi:hypothetical protein ABZ671_17455 [Micromonospora sp. NPDC006766]|uniref:hypothetical protein n=1 Tax=Micromonospora sp. NPDC006766 TaxID=3154778 RepID=UPI0033D5C00D
MIAITSKAVNPRARWLAAGLTGTVLAGMTGCGDDKPAVTPSSSPSAASASPSPTADAESAEAEAAALTAYQNYVRSYVAASNKGDYNAKLDRFVANPALLTVRQDLLIKFQQGLVTTGEPVSAPAVSKVDTTRRPFTAEIEDCFDTSGWDVVSKKTGKSARTKGQATRYVVIAQAELFGDGQWRIREVNAQRERSC